MPIITRTEKGSPLTHAEMDENLNILNTSMNGRIKRAGFTTNSNTYQDSWSSSTTVIPLITFDLSTLSVQKVVFNCVYQSYSKWIDSNGSYETNFHRQIDYGTTLQTNLDNFDFDSSPSVLTLEKSIGWLGYAELVLLSNPTTKHLHLCLKSESNVTSSDFQYLEENVEISYFEIGTVTVHSDMTFVSQSSLTE